MKIDKIIVFLVASLKTPISLRGPAVSDRRHRSLRRLAGATGASLYPRMPRATHASTPLALLILAKLHHTTTAYHNGVGRTPAMGFNTWNAFRCDISDDIVLDVARAIVDTGLRDAGYLYVNIDDCWMEKRDDAGHIVPDAKRFPRGMKALADDIHALGLRFGVYSDAGNFTCEGLPGTLGHEAIDARDYASWGVDYVKFDYCAMDRAAKRPRYYYERMRDALNATGRPMIFSICSWGIDNVHTWGREVGHSWRTGRDLFAVWDEHTARKVLKLPGFLQSVTTAIEQQADQAHVRGAGAYGFNDPDMLLVGLDGMVPYGLVDECPDHIPAALCKRGGYVSRELWGRVGGLTPVEQRTHFAFWCLLASPLMIGGDPRTLRADALAILSARELIAISQDELALQGERLWRDEAGGQIWGRRLSGERYALLIYNGGQATRDIVADWSTLLPQVAKRHETDVPRYPPCVNKEEQEKCGGWAKSGECERNAGFMMTQCAAECNACPPAQFGGRIAMALVRDAWGEEYLGLFPGSYTAVNVEPHGSRMLVIRFEETSPDSARLAPLVEQERAPVRARRRLVRALSSPSVPLEWLELKLEELPHTGDAHLRTGSHHHDQESPPDEADAHLLGNEAESAARARAAELREHPAAGHELRSLQQQSHPSTWTAPVLMPVLFATLGFGLGRMSRRVARLHDFIATTR